MFPFLPTTLDVAKLDAILGDPGLRGAIVSATVTDSEGRLLYQHNQDLHVIPASNEKLFTAAFALARLGPDYRPRTRIWNLPRGLVVDAPGDPMLLSGDLIEAAQKLGAYNRDDIWVREAYAPGFPPSWEWDDLPNKFAAAIDSLSVDRGAFALWSENGRPVLKPDRYGVAIVRHAEAPKFHWMYDPVLRRVDVWGPIPAGTHEIDTLAVPHPDQAAASLLGRRFHSVDSVPDSPPDLTLTGHSTIEMLKACLQPSDNNIAEHLFLIAGGIDSPLGDDPYGTSEGNESSFLRNAVGLDPGDFRVFDGSGLSRVNYTTTRAIAKLMAWSLHQPTSAAWRDCLAGPGRGTLRSRLAGLDFSGKTGSMGLVSSLSGYLRLSDGSDLIVSLVMNEFAVSISDVQKIQDAFVRALPSQ